MITIVVQDAHLKVVASHSLKTFQTGKILRALGRSRLNFDGEAVPHGIFDRPG
jgi:hypothetical protein